jgi:hypothetical protein
MDNRLLLIPSKSHSPILLEHIIHPKHYLNQMKNDRASNYVKWMQAV